jgi:hypothetical protein
MSQPSRPDDRGPEPTEDARSTEGRSLGEPPSARDGADADTDAQREAAAGQQGAAAELRLGVEGDLPEDAPLRNPRRRTAGEAWTGSGSVG